ncbi:hypothetical protein L7F22_019079 [Adiantum nelumboides]|nr:hypothetical protein [Adiantum nelumboides]
MTANANGLSQGLESISFSEAQRDPQLLNPTGQVLASTSKNARRRRKKDASAPKSNDTALEDVGEFVKKSKSQRVRQRKIRKKKSAELKAVHDNGAATPTPNVSTKIASTTPLPINLPKKSQSNMQTLDSPRQPGAMANGASTNGKLKKDFSKHKDENKYKEESRQKEEGKSKDGNNNKDERKGKEESSSKSEDKRTDKEKEGGAKLASRSTLPLGEPNEEDIAKKKEEENARKKEEEAAKKKAAQDRRVMIAQNENAIAQSFALHTMQANANYERDYGILWCQNMRKDAFPQDTEQDFRNRVIGRQVSMLWETTRPSEYVLQMRETVIKEVQDHIVRRWPGCNLRVAPFGSTSTGLIEATSDIDLCLLDPTRPRGVGTPRSEVLPLPNPNIAQILHNERIIGIPGAPDYYNVAYLARALERYSFSFKEVQPIRHAKVPIVKFTHADSGLEGDLNVNDSFGLQNSDMITHYIDICPKIVAPFLFFIKKWAARRHINDPSGKSGIISLNSYTLTVFGLQYLQIKGIVPNLQSASLIATLQVPEEYLWQRPKGSLSSRRGRGKSEPDESDEERIEVDPDMGGRRFDTTFCRLKTDWDFAMAQEDSSNWRVGHCEAYSIRNAFISEEENDRLLGSLLEGFFDWLASFDFENCGISLREGHPVRRIRHLTDSEQKTLGAFPYLKQWDPSWKESAMLCQDPFILDRNTCGAVLDTTQVIIANEAKRAHKILTNANASSRNGQNSQVSPLLSDLMLDWEYEQLLENHKQTMKGWESERVGYIESEAKARSKDPRYNPTYNRIRDRRAREAQKQIAAKRVPLSTSKSL